MTKLNLRIFQPDQVMIVVIYSFAQQISTECLIQARHYSKCWGYSSKHIDQESEQM